MHTGKKSRSVRLAFCCAAFGCLLSAPAAGGVDMTLTDRQRWLYPQMDMELYRVHEMRDTVRRMGLWAMHPGKLPPLRDCAEFRRRCAESDPLPEAAGRLSARYDAKDGMRYVTVNGGFLVIFRFVCFNSLVSKRLKQDY